MDMMEVMQMAIMMKTMTMMMEMIVMMITRGAACVARSSPSPVSELCQITIARLPTTTADGDDDPAHIGDYGNYEDNNEDSKFDEDE